MRVSIWVRRRSTAGLERASAWCHTQDEESLRRSDLKEGGWSECRRLDVFLVVVALTTQLRTARAVVSQVSVFLARPGSSCAQSGRDGSPVAGLAFDRATRLTNAVSGAITLAVQARCRLGPRPCDSSVRRPRQRERRCRTRRQRPRLIRHMINACSASSDCQRVRLPHEEQPSPSGMSCPPARGTRASSILSARS